jgi:hypothetical protein
MYICIGGVKSPCSAGGLSLTLGDTVMLIYVYRSLHTSFCFVLFFGIDDICALETKKDQVQRQTVYIERIVHISELVP